MTHTAISVENLSKAYHIGLKQERHDTFVGALNGLLRAPLKNIRHLSRLNTFKHCDDSEDIFWALRDISFEVQEGEVVGIIGRNGAGKSTLLKILSRITEPTSGRAIIRGRVSSLLEVGTGFHQELTGRENVYMNGTILGMTKREIDRKFDEIVDFSGVEKFLDTPIKHYSSGMKVRLAFSVAAHLEPEILIIDEVLAVGDAEFQKKCLGKMQDVARGGRTVLFVSHNMAAVENLCSVGIALANGRVVQVDGIEKVTADYLTSGRLRGEQPMHRSNGSKIVVREVTIRDLETDVVGVIRCGSDAVIQVRYESVTPLEKARLGMRVDSLSGTPITHLQSEMSTGVHLELSPSGTISCTIRNVPFLPGFYNLAMALYSRGMEVDRLRPAIEFEVESGDFFGTGRLPPNSWGAFLIRSEWSVESKDLTSVDLIEGCRSTPLLNQQL